MIYKTRCPKCAESGKDRHGDNMTIYPDGGKHCFSCGYHVNGAKFKMQDQLVQEDSLKLPPIDFARPFEQPEIDWFLKYKLTPEEIEGNFYWDSSSKRIIHKDHTCFFWEARSVRGATPKTLSYNRKTYKMGGKASSSTVVFVEDIVSAIKVGRHYGTVCLFGSTIPESRLLAICKNPFVTDIVFWLDNDKFETALEYAKYTRPLCDTAVVLTDEDPKYYDNEFIIRQIQEVT